MRATWKSRVELNALRRRGHPGVLAPAARTGALLAALPVSVALAADVVYVTNASGDTFCYQKLEPIQCKLELLKEEDVELCVQSVGATMGGVQTRLAVNNGDLAQPIHAVGVGATDEILFSLGTLDDPTSGDWASVIVSRAAWDAGFEFEGAAGLWTIPNTTGTFDALFGTEFDKAAVFWVSSNFDPTPIGAGESGSMYVGDQDLLALQSRTLPVVLFGDGVQLQTGDAPIHKLSREDGLVYSALGGASLSAEPDTSIRAHNLGSSGEDGFSIDLGEAEGFGLQTTIPTLPSDAAVQTEVLGSVDGAAATIVTHTLQRGGGAAGPVWNTTVDFNPNLWAAPGGAEGAPGAQIRVEMFDASGALVGGFDTGNPAFYSVTEEGVPSYKSTCRKKPSGPTSTDTDTGGETTVEDLASGLVFSNVSTIRSTPINTTTSEDFVSEARITANVGELVVTEDEVQKFGAFISPLHIATLEPNAAGLKVSNLGSTGFDGICIECAGTTSTDPEDLGKIEALSLGWDLIGPCAGVTPTPPGCEPSNAALEIESTAVLDADPAPLRKRNRVRVARQSGSTAKSVSVDYSELGSSTVLIEIRSAGSVVATIPGHPNGPVATVDDWPKGCNKRPAQVGGVRTACYALCFPQEQTIHIFGGSEGAFMGDEIRILAENPTAPFLALEDVEVRGTELHQMQLTSLETTPLPDCPADLNGDLQVDGADLGLLLLAWAPGGGVASPADLNDDNQVDGADLGLLLLAWGACF